MMIVRVQGGGARLSGSATAPPDKSITHRALIFAALGEGRTRVFPLSRGADNRSTARALQALGVQIELDEAGGQAWVTGVGGPHGFTAPSGPIDCGNSGTTLRMLAGVLAASPLEVTLTGDESLSARPMDRLEPLTAMGASIDGVRKGSRLYPPIVVRGAALHGVEHRLKIASAQVKSALLLAGLWASGETVVHEPERSRDHTERMLRGLGVPVHEREDGGLMVSRLHRPWHAGEIEVAPDPSSAAFLLAAAVITGSEELEVISSVNPTRSGFLDVLRAFGVEVEERALQPRGGEPVSAIRVRVPGAGLRGTEIAGALTLRAIDEIPVIAALAAFVPGKTVIRDAAELRVKESDRLAATAALLRAFGGEAEELPDGLVISGDPTRLHGAEVDGGSDHRLAMTAVVMGLGARGFTAVRGAEIIEVSYPGFEAELARLGGQVSTDLGATVPG